MKKCFDCKSEIPANANVCSFCGTRVQGTLCTDCMSFCPSKAKKCKWCGNSLIEKTKILSSQKNLLVNSEFLPTLLLELKFTPQKVKFTQEKIEITSYSLFGFVSRNEEIPWEKVAGFSHKSGLVWDHIYIETRGQTAGLIKCLSKTNANKIKQLLQKLEK